MVLLWLVHVLNTALCSAASTVTSTPPRRSNSRGPRALNYCDVPAAGMALLFALSQVFAVVAPTPSPEDAAASGASSTFHIANDDRGDTYTSAYINVTREFEGTWIWDRSKVGRYGGGYIGAAFGAIVHVTAADNPDDHSGCQLPLRSSRSDRRLPEPGAEPWIALIKRGKCNFEVKVENAFRSSAAGVLVYNDRDSSNLDKMKLSSENGRNISAIFTYKWKGEELARLVENDGRVLVHITIAEHTSSRSGSINRTSVLFVSITFIVLMIISLAWLVFYYVQRFRYIHAKDRLSRRLCNAAKKALSKIPTKNIKSDDKEIGEGECCAICIEPYKTSDVLRILPCTHEFHKNCIDPWLLEHRTCPMCKMDILKHYGFVFTGSQESILHMEMDIEVVAGLDSGDIANSPRRSGGISPLPQIRAVVDHQRSYGSSIDGDDQSRSSSPNELTPSLSSSNHRRNNHTTVTIPSVAKAANNTATPTTSTLPVATPTPQQQSQTTTTVVNNPATVLPVRQDLCVSCIAAAAAAASLVNQSSESSGNTAAVTSTNDCDKSERQQQHGDESDDTNSSSDSSSQRVETSKLVQ